MLISLATLKLAVSVLSIVCVALAAAVAFSAYSIDRLNRDVSRLVGDVGTLRSDLRGETTNRKTWIDCVLSYQGHLSRSCTDLRDAIDSVDEDHSDRLNKLDEYLTASERTCGNIGGDFALAAESLSAVSSDLFGASNALLRASLRYRGRDADGPTYDQAEAGGDVSRGTLVERYGEDVCSLDAVDDDDDEIPF